MAGKYHVRSISLPSRSHPSTIIIEDELSRVNNWKASSALLSASESICAGLSGLENLYRCMDDVLNVTSTRQVLSQHQHERCVDEMLDGSVRLLDICGIARDYMVRIKEHVRSLQSALRRRKGDSSIENNIIDYSRFRKEMKKQGKKLVNELKQMSNKLGASSAPLMDDDQDQHFSAMVGVLTEVNVMNISIFQSLFSFLSAPVVSSKQTRWSLVSKLMHKGVKISCEDQPKLNELESVDAALGSRHCWADVEKMQIARKRLVALERSIESLESRLECVFRHLIKARISLLNIISQ